MHSEYEPWPVAEEGTASGSPGVGTLADEENKAGKQTLSKTGVPYYLPRGRVVVELVEITRAGIVEDYRLDIKDNPSLYPDLRERHVLIMDEDAFSHDRFCVARSNDGLLMAIDMASDNIADELIIKIAETAKALALLGAAYPTRAELENANLEPRAAEPSPPVEKIVYSAAFDPFDPKERESVQTEIDQQVKPFIEKKRAELDAYDDGPCAAARTTNFAGAPSTMRALCGRLDPLRKRLDAGARGNTTFMIRDEYKPTEIEKDRAHCTRAANHGVCFRTLIGAPMEVGFAGRTSRVTVLIPDYRFVGNLDLKRALMVKKQIRVRLDRGILGSVVVDKPSEGLAVASLPLSVLNAILDVPAQFFNKIAAGFTSQAEATKAQAELIKAQAETDKILADALTEQTMPPSGEATQTAGDIGKSVTTDAKIDVKFTCTPANLGQVDG